jgi:hypothetical protein
MDKITRRTLILTAIWLFAYASIHLMSALANQQVPQTTDMGMTLTAMLIAAHNS